MACIPRKKSVKGCLGISQNSGNHNKYLLHNEEKINSGKDEQLMHVSGRWP